MLDNKTPAEKVAILRVAIAQWREMYSLDPSQIVERKLRELNEELRDAEEAAKENEADERLTRIERTNFKDVRLMSALQIEGEQEGCRDVTRAVEEMRDACYDPMGNALTGSKAKLFQCERVLILMSNRTDELKAELEDRNEQIRRQQDATALRENAVGVSFPARELSDAEKNALSRGGLDLSVRPSVAYPDGEDPYEDEDRDPVDKPRRKKKKPKVEPIDPNVPILPPEAPGKKTREIELDE